MEKIFSFDSSVFIETPFILNYKNDFEIGGINTDYHISDLLGKLTNIPNILNSDLKISKIIKGKIYFDEDDGNFFFLKNKKKMNIVNSASGIKSFGILQILESIGEFNRNILLIIDEPESHPHPAWQVEYAKILVEIIKKSNVKVLVTSHSPYLIEALNKFSKKLLKNNDVNFYLSETKNDKVKIIDKTENKEEIFKKLSEPFEKLVFGK